MQPAIVKHIFVIVFSKFRKADWEKDETFCKAVRRKPPFNNGKLLLDMIDAHTFDFLTGTGIA